MNKDGMENSGGVEHFNILPEEGKSKGMGYIGHKWLVILTGAAISLAVLAFLIAVISLGNHGNGGTNRGASVVITGSGRADGIAVDKTNEDRVWMFAIGHAGVNTEYIDEKTGQVRGFNVDIVNAVCALANKNCEFVWDVYTRCWDSQSGERARGGEGLMARWYDACTGWGVTYDRARTFTFTSAYSKIYPAVFATVQGNTRAFNWRDLTGKTLGFIDGWFGDENCLARTDGIQGVKLPMEQVKHYSSVEDLVEAVIANQVDAVFVSKISAQRSELQIVSDDIFGCSIDGHAMMTQRDNDLPQWWNPALERLLQTPDYHDRICKDLAKAHGHMPGLAPSDMCIGM